MSDRDLRTRFSMQALDLATAFKTTVGQKRFGPVGWAPELAAPDVSTGGGKQAQQPIRLNPTQKGFNVLTIGSANQVERHAELRTFEYVDRVHRERFAKAVPLDRQLYGQLLDECRKFFESWGIRVTLQAPPAGLATSAEPAIREGGGGSLGRILGGVLLVAAIAVGVVYFLLSRH